MSAFARDEKTGDTMSRSLRIDFLAIAASLSLLTSCGSQQEILSGLSEVDANQVIVLLQSKDISATKVSVPGRTVTFSIKVSGSDEKEALKLLVDNKLPKVKSPGLAQVYPVGGGGLIPSATQEKAQLMMALQGEIENMLLVLPGIVQARVVIVLPDNSIVRDASAAQPHSTASVAIVYNPDAKGAASVTSDEVKYMLASAVPDLSASSVTVVMAANTPATFSEPKVETASASLSQTSGIDETTLLAFGAVAAAALLFGLLALARSLFLRSKLRKLQSVSENI